MCVTAGLHYQTQSAKRHSCVSRARYTYRMTLRRRGCSEPQEARCAHSQQIHACADESVNMPSSLVAPSEVDAGLLHGDAPFAPLSPVLCAVLADCGLSGRQTDRFGIAIFAQRSFALGEVLLRERPILTIDEADARGHPLFPVFLEACQQSSLEARSACGFLALCEADATQRGRVAALFRPKELASESSDDYRRRLHTTITDEEYRRR